MDEEKHHLQLCNLVSRGFSLNEARAKIAKAEQAVIGEIHKVAEKVATATAPKPPVPPKAAK
jgi:hypothetical protein